MDCQKNELFGVGKRELAQKHVRTDRVLEVVRWNARLFVLLIEILGGDLASTCELEAAEACRGARGLVKHRENFLDADDGLALAA